MRLKTAHAVRASATASYVHGSEASQNRLNNRRRPPPCTREMKGIDAPASSLTNIRRRTTRDAIFLGRGERRAGRYVERFSSVSFPYLSACLAPFPCSNHPKALQEWMNCDVCDNLEWRERTDTQRFRLDTCPSPRPYDPSRGHCAGQCLAA